MPTEISEANLKIDLHNILDRVARGEEILVKREEGVAVRLVPSIVDASDAGLPLSQADRDKAFAELRAFRTAHPLNGLNILELRDEGRKY